MSDSSDLPVLRSVRGKKKGTKNSPKNEKIKSPLKVRRDAMYMCVEVLPKELKYRQKYFQDEQQIIRSYKVNCTTCGCNLQHLILEGRDIYSHPVLKVLMCKACVEFYGDGDFSTDEDGSDSFCRWCAQGGTLYCCAKCSCAFCKKCIKNNLKRSILDDIEDEDWKCFVCDIQPLWELRAVAAAAISYANQVRRHKRKEISDNLKVLQKKVPEKTQSRRQNKWQKSSSSIDGADESNVGKYKKKRYRSTSSESESDSGDHIDKKQKTNSTTEADVIQIGSTDGETEESNEDVPIKLNSKHQTKNTLGSGKEEKNKPRIETKQEQKKRFARKSDSDNASTAAKLRRKETASQFRTDDNSNRQLDKQSKESRKGKYSKIAELSTLTKNEDKNKEKRLLKNILSDAEENSSLPDKTDKGTAQWFCRWLKDLGQDIIDQSNLCSISVNKCIEKRVHVEKMIETKNAEKTINLLHTLIELTRENLERAKGLLTLNHKYWKSRAIKLSRELHDEDSEMEDDKLVLETGKKHADKDSVGNSSTNDNGGDHDDDADEDDALTTEHKKRNKSTRTATKRKMEALDRNLESMTTINMELSNKGISDSDETHLSEADTKSIRKQKLSKKMKDTRMKKSSSENTLRNKKMEENSSSDPLCNGINKALQDECSASGNDTCTVSEDFATDIVKETLKPEASKESKKNADDLKKVLDNGADEKVEEQMTDEKNKKKLENSTSSSSKQPDESESQEGNIESETESTASINNTNENNKENQSNHMETTTNISEDENKVSIRNLDEESKSDNIKDMSLDFFGTSAAEKQTESDAENGNQKSDDDDDDDDKVSMPEDDKSSTHSETLLTENKNKNGEKINNESDDAESVCSALTLECLDDQTEKIEGNSQESKKKSASDMDSSQNSCSIDIKDEKIMSSAETQLEKIDHDIDEILKEKTLSDETGSCKISSPENDMSGQVFGDPKSSTNNLEDKENSSATVHKKGIENLTEGATREKQEEESENTTPECKAKQSLLGYSSDDENEEKDENDGDSLNSETSKKKKRLKGKPGIVDTSTPLKKKNQRSKKHTKKGDELLSLSDIASEDSEEENQEKIKVKSKIKSKSEDKLEKGEEMAQESSENNSNDGETSEKEQHKDQDIKSLLNMKSLKKKARNATDDSEGATDVDTDMENEKEKKKKILKKKKEKKITETLLDFFDKKSDDEGEVSSASSDSDNLLKIIKQKNRSLVEKQNELAKKMMMENSTTDNDVSEDEAYNEKPESKKKKKEVTDDPNIKEENMHDAKTEDKDAIEKEKVANDDDEVEVIQVKDTKYSEVLEISSDKEHDEDNEDADSAAKEKMKKKSWRRDKLLTMKLTDTDSTDEERKWKAKKKCINDENESDSEDESKAIGKPKRKSCRRIVASDESEVISSDSSSGDIFDVKSKKSGKNAKKTSTNNSSDSDAPAKPKKIPRKRIKALNNSSTSASSEDEADTSQKNDSQSKGRKNIRRVMKDESVGEATRRAAKEEEDRKKRLAEKQLLYNEIFNEVGVETIDKLVLDFDPETKKELVAVHPSIVSKLKPHQVKGVKFMWESSFESLKQIKKTKGSGCILAHCMGLGKSLQVVTLLHTILTHKATKVHTAMVVCPLSTVQNWVNEFNIWLKDIEDVPEINIYELSRYKQNYERMYQLNEWHEDGGVLVIGYDMYRNLSNPTGKRLRKKVIENFQRTLVDPGPDVVICDEGHLLKNEDTALSKAMRKIRTLRRIVLTGTPLQNNLREYHCMVQFVKPNLLGTRKEFLNRFVNPITNGQFEDSTAHDVKIMKRRAHVLHKMLEGSVQRFDYAVLTPFLPPKYEYVIAIRLTETQIKIYRHYLENYSMRGEKGKGAKLFTDFQNLQRIWTHPRVLQMSADKAERIAEKKRLMESDSEGSLRDFIDDSDASSSESNGITSVSDSDSDIQVLSKDENPTTAKSKNKRFMSTRSKGLDAADEESNEKGAEEGTSKPGEWWEQFIQGDEMENLKESGKLILLFSILQECEKIGDKVLLFSQSLYSLDLIEYFLGCVDAATQANKVEECLSGHTGSWSIGLDYFRLDGSTPGETRSAWCKAFNREDNTRARLFLISTRAGGLGINLYAANRVIIFDASWNPSHDVQSIFRVYRFGQKKPCYIYRFLAQGTMEEKIYDRQVTKLSLSCRVVDEQQIERYYKMADLQELYQFDPEQKTKRPTPILPKDRLLAELLKAHEQWIDNYHEHDSLLENVEGEELNEEERKAAWEEYENEKQGKINVAGLGYLNNMGFPEQLPNTNVPALRDALKKQNPTATDDQIENQLMTVMNQLRIYLNNMQPSTSAPNPNYGAYNAQMSPQLQYIQQQQQTYQRMLQQQQQQQQHQFGGMGWNPSYSPQYGQNLQDGQQGSYASGMYRNMMTNPSLTSLLNKPSQSLQKNQPSGRGDMVISREPVVLPTNKTLQMQRKLVPLNPPPAHSSSRFLPVRGVGSSATAMNQKKPEESKKFSNEVIETID